MRRGSSGGAGWLIGVALLLAAPVRAQDVTESAPPDPEQSLLDTFYQTLSLSGQWVSMDGLGWCWRPSAASAGADFRPYATGGSWALTADGWEFQSQWDWGDIVFHYGRWYDDASYGWLWVPGTDWAPAWVDWRENDSYAGWMPLAPDGLGVPTDAPFWYFVAFTYFTGSSAYLHAVPPAQAASVYSSTQHVAAHGPLVGVVKAGGGSVSVKPGVRIVTPVVVTPLPQQQQQQQLQQQRVIHLTPPPSRPLYGQSSSSAPMRRRFEPTSSSHGKPAPRGR